MASHRPLISLVLAAALLAGQWLAAAHQPEHGMQPAAEHACAVCVYAHGAATGAVPAVPHVTIDGVLLAPETPADVGRLAAILRQHPIRGPPALLV